MRKILRPWLVYPAAACALSAPLYGQEAVAQQGAQATSSTDQPEQFQEDKFYAMGFYMAEKFGFSQNYSEEEIEAIAEGTRDFISGEEPPENLQQELMGARMLFVQRIQEERQKMQAANEKEAEEFFATLEGKEGVKKSDSGLYYKITEEGDAEKKPGAGDRVSVFYEGRLADGTVFDSNMDRDEPTTFPVGGVVKGFGEGLQLIGEGGKATLYMPADLGYGNQPRPDSNIEPGDALIFDIHLVKVQPPRSEAPRGKMPPGGPPNMTPPPLPPNLTPPPLPPNLKPPQGPPPGVKPKPQQSGNANVSEEGQRNSSND